MAINNAFKALSISVRREILIYLRGGRKTVSEISDYFEVPLANISYHLGKLKEVDLVRENKYKNYIYYELNLSLFEELVLWFEQFKGGNL